jgi:peptidoglycan-N-acetylglucosamine deacetylase
MPNRPVRARYAAALLTLLVSLTALAAPPAAAAEGRPLLITVDDLPISSGRLHLDPAERERITREMLAVLAEHHVPAVGFVTWGNVRDEADRALLGLWLQAGHELGNHAFRHPNYTATAVKPYLEDVEAARRELQAFLDPHGRTVRFFRFPYLREGDTPQKLDAARDYLVRSGQRSLPVTLDNQDWSFEAPWVEARRAGQAGRMLEVAEDYHAAMRLAVRHHAGRGERLFGRPVPEILLLHAGEVGAAQWDRLFTWLRSEGFRFATADEVLSDPVFAEAPRYVGPYGFGLWDRILHERRVAEAIEAVTVLLREQAEAWSRGDLEAFVSAYAEDAVFVSPSGLTRGRDEVLERYRKRYPDAAAMGRLTLEVLETRAASGAEVSMLGDAVPSRVHAVSVVARWTLAYPEGELANGLTLLVLQPRGDRWLIVQDASM